MKQKHRTNDNSLYSLYRYGQDERAKGNTLDQKNTKSRYPAHNCSISVQPCGNQFPVRRNECWPFDRKCGFRTSFRWPSEDITPFLLHTPFMSKGPVAASSWPRPQHLPHAVPFHRPNVFGAVRPQKTTETTCLWQQNCKVGIIRSFDLLSQNVDIVLICLHYNLFPLGGWVSSNIICIWFICTRTHAYSHN